MPEEERDSVETLGHKLETVLRALWEIVADITDIATLEYKLAKRSLRIIILLVPFTCLSLLGLWLFLLLTISQVLVKISNSWLISFSLITGLNALLLIGLGVLLKYSISNLYFKTTRRQLKSLSGAKLEFIDNKTKKTNNSVRETTGKE